MKREDDPALDELLTVLEKDCSQFIKDTGGFLYRSTNRSLGGKIYQKVKSRKDRRPVDTPRNIHNWADQAFKKRFGWKARSEGVFTATRPAMTKGYGMDLYLVFPLNGYKYVWSKEHYDFFISQSELETKLN